MRARETRFCQLIVVLVATAIAPAPFHSSRAADDAKQADPKIEYAILCIVSHVCDELDPATSEQILAARAQELKNYRGGNGQTLLQFTLAAIQASTPGEEKARTYAMAERLLSLGADINARGSLGVTALHDAVLFNNAETVQFLLSKGASALTAAGPGRYEGLSALEFAKLLQSKKPTPEREKIIEMLKDTQRR